MAQAKFISGDGVEHTCQTDSVAYRLMAKDGSFVLAELDGVRQPVSAVEPAASPLDGMSKKDLLAYAAENGIEVNAKLKTADVLAVIKEAEAANAGE